MVSHTTSTLTPRTNNPRPSLPAHFANPKFSELNSKLPPVKFQEILREGQTIVVGRLKIATPSHPGHAFILRRYDTGAISLTTMFKAAFPTAPEEFEKAESAWVKANFDVSGANGSPGADGTPKLRLNGTWVGAALAQHIAPSYGLSHIMTPLIEARPDPNQAYRKSSKSSPSTATQNATVSPGEPVTSPATKRRRGSPATTPVSPTVADSKSTPVRSSPRRSTRQGAGPRATTPLVREAHTPGGSDETAVNADDEEEAEVPGPDMVQDIKEQKALIADLKAKRDAAGAPATPHNPRKRQNVETDPPLSFDFNKEPEVGEREIVQRKRVQLRANQKAAAWGTLAFAVGLGAASLLPRLFF